MSYKQAKHPVSPNVNFTFPNHKTHFIYSVNVHDPYVLMYSYEMTWSHTLGCSEQNEPMFVYREDNLLQHPHLNAFMTHFYAHQNDDLFL
jgi:hypothetical protein